jgi:sarcosine oxidase subunit beta
LVKGFPVSSIEEGKEQLVIHGPGAAIRTEVVVVAAGARSSGVSSWLEDKVVPVREQALKTSPVSLSVPGVTRAGYGYTTLRQLSDGCLMVSGCRWATSHMELGEVDDSVVVDKIQRKLDETISRLYPDLSPPRVTDRWAWLYARTCDMLPIVGPVPGNPRVVMCTGFVGNPYGLAVGAARAVADGLLKEGPPELPGFMSAMRFV